MSSNKDYYWLNSHSRLFLERDYLEEGVTPEDRIKQTADNAEKILKLKGFSDKFQNYMAKGFYSLATPIWTNFGNKRGLPVSCVTGDTWINTRLSGGKMAKDIQIGDEVLTHKGRYRKVIGIIPTKNRNNIYKLKVSNRMTPLFLTGDHLVLTNLGWIECEKLDTTKHFVAINGDCEYIEKDFTLDLKLFCDYDPHIIEGKIHKKIVDNKKCKKRSKNGEFVEYYSNPKEFVKIDEDLCWALGFWFAEGSLSIRKGNPSGIRVTYNDKDEKILGEKWLEIIKEKFNLNGNTYFSSYTRENGKTASWANSNINSNIIGNLFASFGKGCKDKIIPQWIIDLPKQKLKRFLDGMLDGDGHITRSNSCRLTVANPKMLMQFYQIGLKLGLEMSLQMQEKASKLSSTKYVYTCCFKKHNLSLNRQRSNSAIKFNDGLFYSPIKELSLTDRVEDVYDFTVEEDHSFSAAGVILHNCFNSHVSDTMESILTKAAEVGIMSKHGGGTSGYFGELRARGTPISVGGKSSGAVHFMEIFDKVANVVSQGSARRGSFAAYLPVEHSDIEEFLQIRSEGHSIQDMSIGVTVTDKFMKELVDGDKDKRKIWAKIIQKRFETGYPYIMFTDNVNKNAPKVYKDKKLKIKSSNLCVAPNTKILTKDGELIIGDNEGREVDVWNGKCWSKTKIVKTGENQKLLKLVFVVREFDDEDTESFNRVELETTEYHKFYLRDGKEVQAKDLTPGDLLLRYKNHKGRLLAPEILEIYNENKTSDTFCVNEPLEHKAVFNGVLTGNCSEISLASDENNSFVCVLSSLNLLHWDEIKDTDAVEILVYFLDAVNEEFIQKTEGMKYMEPAHNFAKAQRALGMGVLGWHSLLQSKMIAFESMQAKLLNSEIWKIIRQRADKATEEMAKEYGEPELLKGYGRRNVTTLAVAPTTSSSFILGQVSPSVEPLNSNYFVKNLAKGKFTYKNPYLKEILKKYDQHNDDTWKTILIRGGSVQHLDFLSQEEKDVFKTFGEISQKEIVIQAAQRQKYIDQSQSLNLMIPPNTSPKEVNSLLIEGWELGVKTFYYQRSANPAQELARSILNCASCEA